MAGALARKRRCAWSVDDALLASYHDVEWGVPSFDDRHLFELLCLEGAQAGLSWLTVLRKRDGYRRAFADFDVAIVARFGDREVNRLVKDPGIVRHAQKIAGVIANARAVLRIKTRYGSFANYLWRFVDGRPVQNAWRTYSLIPAETPASRAMSKALRSDDFKFVGPTICYAFMQAVGMVNDHERACFRQREVRKLGRD